MAKVAGEAKAPASLWPTSSLLARIQERERMELLRMGTRAVFPRHHALIRQGSNEDHVVLLTKGLTKVVVDAANGYEALLAIRAGGDLVGEMASLEGRPRSATVISCVQTSARLIPADLFTSFLKSYPNILLQVTRILSERLRFANEKRVAFAALPASARVAQVLVEVTHTYGRCTDGVQWELGLSLSSPDIASFAGVSLSSAEKSLRTLQDNGLIKRQRRSAVITDMGGLRTFASGLGVRP